MSMGDAIRTVLSKYATFDGRAARPEYWWWVLFYIVAIVATTIVDGVILGPVFGDGVFDPDAPQPLSGLLYLALLLPNLAVGARRLHDVGRSGWWLLLALLPVIGALVLIFWFVQPGDPGANEYGPPPGADEYGLPPTAAP